MTVYAGSEKRGDNRITWNELITWYQDNPDELVGKTTQDIIEDIVNVVIVASYTGDEQVSRKDLTLVDLMDKGTDFGLNFTIEKSMLNNPGLAFITANTQYQGQLNFIDDLKGIIHNVQHNVSDMKDKAFLIDAEERPEIESYDFTALDNLHFTFAVPRNMEPIVPFLIGDSEQTGLSVSDFYPPLETSQVTGEIVSYYYGSTPGYVATEDGSFYSTKEESGDPIKDANGNIVRAVFKYGDAEELVATLDNLQIKELQDLMIFYDRATYEPLIESEGFLSSNNAELTFISLLMEEGNNSVLMNALNPDTYDNVVSNYNSEVSDWNNIGFGATKSNVVKGIIDKTTDINSLDDAMGVGTDYWRERHLINPSPLEMEAELQKYFNALGLNMTSSDAVRFGKHLLKTRQVEADRTNEIGKQIEIMLSGMKLLETQAFVTEKPEPLSTRDEGDYAKVQAYNKNLALYNEFAQAKEEGRVRTIAGVGVFIAPTEEEVREHYGLPKLDTYNSELEFNKIMETGLADRIGAVNNVNTLREQSAKFQNRFLAARQFMTEG